LLLMARGAAQSVQQVFLVLVVIGMISGVALGVWWIRPTPSYSAEDLTVGSPFDVTFRAENRNPWFGMANLKISCVLESVRASGIPPTSLNANDVRFPAGSASGLAPGESATFACPFRSLIGHPINDDPAVAQRAEIYFRSEYDLELFRSFRITDYSAHFVLDMRFLPPRWVRKP
jgi:hypothetical protein